MEYNATGRESGQECPDREVHCGLTARALRSPHLKPEDDSAGPLGAEERGSGAGDVTALLIRARRGDPHAAEELFQFVYQDLRRLARRQLAGKRPDATLSATALVHETYLRLARPGNLDQLDRNHFFAVAARAMRQIIVSDARQRGAAKRGEGAVRLELEDFHLAVDAKCEEILAVHEALDQLENLDARLARLVELRYFAGLSSAETATVTGQSERSLRRDWAKARAVLLRSLESREAAP